MSSIASTSSLSTAAIVFTPTGPPSNRSMIARSSLRSMSSNPCSSISSSFRALPRHCRRDFAVAFHLRIVANPLQQPIRHARRPAASLCDFAAAFGSDRRAQNFRRTPDDEFQIRHGIEIQAVDHAEARPQRRRNQPGASRRADQREAPQIQPMRARAWALADDDVEFEVLHRRIEDFFDVGLKPMNLVDEENVADFEIRQNRREVALELDQRTGRRAEPRAHFVGDHRSESGLAETRRTVQQDVIERFAALSCGLDRNIEVVFDVVLADVFRQHASAAATVRMALPLRPSMPRNNSLRHVIPSSESEVLV